MTTIDLSGRTVRVAGAFRGGAKASSRRLAQWAGDSAAKNRRGPRRSVAFVEACDLLDLSTLKCLPLEVVLAALAGDTNDEIARSLRVSRSTVKYHVSRVIKHRAGLLCVAHQGLPPKA